MNDSHVDNSNPIFEALYHYKQKIRIACIPSQPLQYTYRVQLTQLTMLPRNADTIMQGIIIYCVYHYTSHLKEAITT
jgi:hypothetical protein